MTGEGKVLIVSAAEKAADTLRTALAPLDVSQADVSAVQSGAQARRMILDGSWRLVMVNAPLRDEFGHELAVFAAEKTGAGVVLLVKAGQAESAAARVEDAGVFVTPKPLERAAFGHAVRLALASNGRIAALQRQNRALMQKIEEIRLIDRAKCALIQYRQLTEPEAHRYLEQCAMDTRRTRREAAREILRMYEGEE